MRAEEPKSSGRLLPMNCGQMTTGCTASVRENARNNPCGYYRVVSSRFVDDTKRKHGLSPVSGKRM